MRRPDLGFQNRSDTNRAIEPQQRARGLNVFVEYVHGSGLRLCFRIMQNKVFLMMRLNVSKGPITVFLDGATAVSHS